MFTLLLGVGVLPIFFDMILLTALFAIEETEQFPLLLLLIVLSFLGYWMITLSNPLVPFWAFVLANPLNILLGFVGYFAIGVGWSFFKWWRYSKIMSPYIQREWESYKTQSRNSSRDLNELKNEFLASSYNPLQRNGLKLSDKNNWKIVNWIVLWPVSLIWNLIRSFTIDIGKTLLSIFGRFYDGIANNVTNKLK